MGKPNCCWFLSDYFRDGFFFYIDACFGWFDLCPYFLAEVCIWVEPSWFSNWPFVIGIWISWSAASALLLNSPSWLTLSYALFACWFLIIRKSWEFSESETLCLYSAIYPEPEITILTSSSTTDCYRDEIVSACCLEDLLASLRLLRNLENLFCGHYLYSWWTCDDFSDSLARLSDSAIRLLLSWEFYFVFSWIFAISRGEAETLSYELFSRFEGSYGELIDSNSCFWAAVNFMSISNYDETCDPSAAGINGGFLKPRSTFTLLVGLKAFFYF